MKQSKGGTVAEGSREGFDAPYKLSLRRPGDNFWGDHLLQNASTSEAKRICALMAGREPIGMWPLLVWAFRREWVRFSCGSLFRPAKVSASTMAWAMSAGASGVMMGRDQGSYFAPCCHADALEVYAAVLWVIDAAADGDARRLAFQLLVKHAEAGAAPTWDLQMEPPRLVPVKRANGKVQHLYGKRNEPIACLLATQGCPAGEQEAILAEAHARHGEWCRLMGEVMHRLGTGCPGLTRWRVDGLGVNRAPWLQVAREAS